MSDFLIIYFCYGANVISCHWTHAKGFFKKNTIFYSNFVLKRLFSLFFPDSDEGDPLSVHGCGFPGLPSNGSLAPSASSSSSSSLLYSPGESVRYRCSSGFVLQGEEERTCGTDGRWRGGMPTCSEYCSGLLFFENLEP